MDGIDRVISNFNDNDRFTSKQSLSIEIDESEVERIADRLVTKLSGTPGYTDSRNYYCGVARRLPWSTLERLADTALEVGDHPGKLFTFLTKKEIKRVQQKNTGDWNE